MPKLMKAAAIGFGSGIALMIGAMLAVMPAKAADKGGPTLVDSLPPAAKGWTGLWFGLNLGYAAETSSTKASGIAFDFSQASDGFTYGAAIGYDIQVATKFVIGAFCDADKTNNQDTVSVFGTPVGDIKISAVYTCGARAGYLLNPETMLYVAGGHSWTSSAANFAGFNEGDMKGYMIGGGLEARLGHGWSAKAEYRFIDLGGDTFVAGPVAIDTDHNLHHVRVGLSYKFDMGR